MEDLCNLTRSVPNVCTLRGPRCEGVNAEGVEVSTHLRDLPVGLPAPVKCRRGQHHTAAAAPSLHSIKEDRFNLTLTMNSEGNSQQNTLRFCSREILRTLSLKSDSTVRYGITVLSNC